MTYADLADIILNRFSKEQQQSDVTIEMSVQDECFPMAEVRICDSEHGSLDEHHPVLFVEE